ncbi:MAG: hypothetical protein KTR14_08205 [Vampirovibrio sp.]|nr:hypothetical protein [Vampirovibrio sp.]
MSTSLGARPDLATLDAVRRREKRDEQEKKEPEDASLFYIRYLKQQFGGQGIPMAEDVFVRQYA